MHNQSKDMLRRLKEKIESDAEVRAKQHQEELESEQQKAAQALDELQKAKSEMDCVGAESASEDNQKLILDLQKQLQEKSAAVDTIKEKSKDMLRKLKGELEVALNKAHENEGSSKRIAELEWEIGRLEKEGENAAALAEAAQTELKNQVTELEAALAAAESAGGEAEAAAAAAREAASARAALEAEVKEVREALAEAEGRSKALEEAGEAAGAKREELEAEVTGLREAVAAAEEARGAAVKEAEAARLRGAEGNVVLEEGRVAGEDAPQGEGEGAAAAAQRHQRLAAEARAAELEMQLKDEQDKRERLKLLVQKAIDAKKAVEADAARNIAALEAKLREQAAGLSPAPAPAATTAGDAGGRVEDAGGGASAEKLAEVVSLYEAQLADSQQLVEAQRLQLEETRAHVLAAQKDRDSAIQALHKSNSSRMSLSEDKKTLEAEVAALKAAAAGDAPEDLAKVRHELDNERELVKRLKDRIQALVNEKKELRAELQKAELEADAKDSVSRKELDSVKEKSKDFLRKVLLAWGIVIVIVIAIVIVLAWGIVIVIMIVIAKVIVLAWGIVIVIVIAIVIVLAWGIVIVIVIAIVIVIVMVIARVRVRENSKGNMKSKSKSASESE